ncbi:circadian locomoter output cycles protein kaput isoform X3 [Drosophila virilis]
MHKDKEENGVLPHIHAHDGYRTRELGAFEHGLLDGDMFLQALNGFLMILTCEGEVFFATHSIESYLGFHQSDIVHQSVYELVHSEDREELQRQLLWNSFLPADMSSMQLSETLAPDKALYLERSFTVRFRCLLDNTSGFLRLDIRGRIKILHGQNRKTEEPPLALFAYCTPFGPPSLLEIPHKENMFKSKHKLDFSLVSMDQRGKHILGYADAELVNMGGYDLVHYDDLAYVASAHQELLKTGASGMIAYRYQKKDGEWQWLQTSSRLVYKNSKPDFVICTHRQLMDEEGHDLLGKRTMDFKVSYLDTGLASTYFSEADQLVVPPTSASVSPTAHALPPPVTPTRPNRRYKTQLRDFLSTCRSKRKLQQQQQQQQQQLQAQQSSPLAQVGSPAPAVVEYLPDPAAAVAAAYSNLNPMYTTSPYATAADNLYMGSSMPANAFYPVSENLFHQYRLQGAVGVGGYYTDYPHTGGPASAYVANGFLSYDGYAIASKAQDDKWQETGKYYSGYSSGYGSPTSTPQQIPLKTPKSSPQVMEVISCSSDGPSPVAVAGAGVGAGVGATPNGSNVTPKVELAAATAAAAGQDPYERQTVLMWGTTQSSGVPLNSRITARAGGSPQRTTPLTNGLSYAHNNNNNEHEPAAAAKWNGNKELTGKSTSAGTPESYQLQHDDSGLYSASSHTTSPQQQQQQQQQQPHSSRGLGSNVSSSSNSITHPVSGTEHPTLQASHAHPHAQQQQQPHPQPPSCAGSLQQPQQQQQQQQPHSIHAHPHTQQQQQHQQQQHHHQHQPQPHPHPHHQHHHEANAAAAAHHLHPQASAGTANGSEILINTQLQQQQQQHLQQQQQQQLVGYTLHHHPLDSPPHCRTPPTLPAVSSLLSGATSTDSSPYQQLAIVSSAAATASAPPPPPLIICADESLQALNSSSNGSSEAHISSTSSSAARGARKSAKVQQQQHQQQQQQQQHQPNYQQHHAQHLLYPANITAHTALAYAPPPSGAYIDGSPLLSFSEVTNTLLNQ